MPLLAQHATQHIGLYLKYGSRTSQPKRVRAFIDHAVKFLSHSAAFVLTPKELEAAGRRKRRA